MADVLHKETLQYLKSVHTPNYDPEEWLINPDLSAVEGVDPKYWKIQDDKVLEMSGEEKDTAYLEEVKAEAFQAIDARTREILAEGFSYRNERFSLSQAAQLRMTELIFLLDQDAPLDFPIVWNTLDDTWQIELSDSTEVRSFIQEGTQTVVSIINSGTSLKAQIRSALTISAVELIKDER